MTIAEPENGLLVELEAEELVVRRGERTIRLDLGPEAPTAIELKAGGSSIKIDASGITIKGLNVRIEGELGAELKGGVQAAVKSDSVTTIQGGLTTIN